MAWIVGIGIFLVLLFAFPKPMFGLIGIVAAAIGVFVLYQWNETTQRQEKKSKITIVTAYDPARCSDPKWPVFVGFVNKSDSTVSAIGFHLTARRKGYSNAVYNDWTTSDKIIAPGAGFGNCWAVSEYSLRKEEIGTTPLSDLDWTASIESVSFQ